jgi:hypothetical protein
METVADKVALALLLAFAAAAVYFVVRLVKPGTPRQDAPVPLGFHQRQRMNIQEFYEAYYLKPGTPIHMSHAQAGLAMFALEARVPSELLRPTDRLSDFGDRSQGLLSTLVNTQMQQAIAKNPKLAGSKLETVDDMIQLAARADEAQPDE